MPIEVFSSETGRYSMAVVVEHAGRATARKVEDGFLPLARCDSCGNVITRGVEGRAARERA